MLIGWSVSYLCLLIYLPPLHRTRDGVDAGDALTGSAILQQGYALAGSSYSQNGWALQQAFNVQVAGSALPIVHITDPKSAFKQAKAILASAQQTAQGRARIALEAALSDIPGWFNPASPEPASKDFTAQEQNQFLWENQVDFAFAFFARAELEARAGGNPSWNTGVNYRRQLEHSIDHSEVEALYQQAGLSLDGDLKTLDAAPRIAADPGALQYLSRYIIFNGDVTMPVLTMHTTGDGLVANQDEQAYASVVRAAGNNPLLREIFVHRAN